MDDIFLIWTDTETSLKEFHQFLNSLDTDIQFTMVYYSESIQFLDVTVMAIDNTLKTKLHVKDTDRNTLLRYESCHPKNMIKSLPYSQMIRVKRITDDHDDLFRSLDIMTSNFLERGYPRSLISRHRDKICDIPREKLFETSKQHRPKIIPFISTYNELSGDISRIMNKHWPILKGSYEHIEELNNGPLMSYRRTQNFRDRLVKTKVKEWPSQQGQQVVLRPIKVRRRHMAALMQIVHNVIRRKRIREEHARGRRFWVHPINVLRYERGHIGHLYDELRRFPRKFYEFCRMSIPAFDALAEILAVHLRRHDTVMRNAISPVERLLITLRFLATGESYSSLHLQFRVGKSTISGIVRCTCQVIWQYLQPIVMPSPSREIWLQVAAGFQSVANFPNCIGAVDGKHVRVQQPPRSGSQYFNYKKYFSVVLMAVADASYKFVAIDVGAYGSTGDSRALLTSDLGKQILLDQVTLPPPQPLPGTTHPVPFVMVSDEAFPLLPNLLRPYPRRRLDARRRVFNERLSRARRFVECTFGIMVSKWRVFTCALQLDAYTVDVVIKAACVLHNYVRDQERGEVDVETQTAFRDAIINWGLGRPSNRGVQVRDAFTDYFMSPEGAVPRQDSSHTVQQPLPD
ncbi:uncharacterized protein LOC142750430 [Rhinoderma darwinii]|uniref:uncharacterized protein LOC142750430 n=1 Tax=Rhinoderma darwinii TaxID=43563 RepID=UPI003F677D93